jgi:hypothetical protein
VVTDLEVADKDGNTNTHKANPTTMRFTYLPFEQNVNGLLAHWDSTGDAKWYVRITPFNDFDVAQAPDVHAIQLHNTLLTPSINITSGMGSCGKFSEGTMIEGKFVVLDDYLREYQLYVRPSVNAPGIGVPSPSSGLANTASAPGDDWELQTKDMTPCGYTIHVRAIARTIRNSQAVAPWRYGSDGFCLEASEETEETG